MYMVKLWIIQNTLSDIDLTVDYEVLLTYNRNSHVETHPGGGVRTQHLLAVRQQSTTKFNNYKIITDISSINVQFKILYCPTSILQGHPTRVLPNHHIFEV